MAEQVYFVSALVVICGAYLRVLAVAGAALRTLMARGRFSTFQLGLVELLNAAEPPVMAVATSLVVVLSFDPHGASVLDAVAATIGAALVLYAWNLTVWSFWSWRSIFFGHGVQEDQELVTRGAYGLVRHPIYLGVLVIWLALSVAFLSAWIFVIAAVYVVPIYILYVRSEENMMKEAFGEQYASYCRRVPMWLPYLRLVPQLRKGDAP